MDQRDYHQELLNGCDSVSGNLDGIYFSECFILESTFSKTTFSGTHFQNTVIANSLFFNCSFHKSWFGGCIWSNVIFIRCTFSSIELEPDVISNVLFYESSASGLYIWNRPTNSLNTVINNLEFYDNVSLPTYQVEDQITTILDSGKAKLFHFNDLDKSLIYKKRKPQILELLKSEI